MPFHDVSNDEFLKVTGAWVHSLASTPLDPKDLFQDVIESPEKTLDNENIPCGNYIESKYHTIKQTGLLFDKVVHKKGFSILHCNMRSLSKNLTLLNDILVTFKKAPDIIAISETKLNDNHLSNISIPGYSFVNTNSKTSAGGVGLYLAGELNFIRRHDLELPADGVESCWLEVTSKKEQNIIIGCVYRHPHSKLESFHEVMKERLQGLNNSGKQVIVLGDININFLQYCNDNRTAVYLDMLFDSGFMPITTKATRITDHSKTLIDHIYTNVPQKVLKASICLAGISDHLPVFCTIAHKISSTNESRLHRDFSNFNKDLFLKEISELDFASLIGDDVMKV